MHVFYYVLSSGMRGHAGSAEVHERGHRPWVKTYHQWAARRLWEEWGTETRPGRARVGKNQRSLYTSYGGRRGTL